MFLFVVFSLQTVGCMPPPVSSAVILTKAVGGNEVSFHLFWNEFFFFNVSVEKNGISIFLLVIAL